MKSPKKLYISIVLLESIASKSKFCLHQGAILQFKRCLLLLFSTARFYIVLSLQMFINREKKQKFTVVASDFLEIRILEELLHKHKHSSVLQNTILQCRDIQLLQCKGQGLKNKEDLNHDLFCSFTLSSLRKLMGPISNIRGKSFHEVRIKDTH